MKKTAELANRFRELFLNGTWIANTNYKDQLENLDWEMAISKLESMNSISVLAQHVHYYVNGIKNVFKGGNLEIRDRYSFEFPAIESQSQWNAFLSKFWNDSENLAELIGKLPDEKLNQSFVDDKYGTYLRNIDGMIEHGYYHLGQIVLTKKLLLKDQ